MTCYETGAFGFHLHRQIEELGIESYMVNPKTGMNGAKA
jgi:transposase